MAVTGHFSYDIEERANHLHVRGISRDHIVQALELLEKVSALQADHAAATRDDLVHALMANNVALTPPASLAQAQRLAIHRDRLLATPVLTHDSLHQLRGDTHQSSTRTWLSRRTKAREVFTINHNGRTLIPAFQLDEHGQPRPELTPILDVLIDAGVQGWSLWTWLTSPTPLLSGQIPERLAQTAAQRVLRAATRFSAPTAA